MTEDRQSHEFTEDEEALIRSGIELDSLDDFPADPEEIAVKPSGIFRYLTPGCQLYLGALLCGQTMKALSKLIMERVDMVFLLFFRMGVTALVTISYMWYNGIEHYFWGPPEVRRLLAFRAICGTAAITLTMFSLKYISLPEQTVLTFLGPLVTPLLACLILHEQYFWQQAAWSLFSFAGVIVVAKPPPFFEYTNENGASLHLRFLAIAATLLVVIFAGLVMVVVRSIGTRAHPLCVVGSYSVLTVVFSVCWMIAEPSRFTLPQTSETWLMLLGACFFGFCLQSMSSVALQKEPVNLLAGFKYTQILWAVIFELVIWHDLPDIWTVVGSTLVAFGVVQATITRQKLIETHSKA